MCNRDSKCFSTNCKNPITVKVTKLFGDGASFYMCDRCKPDEKKRPAALQSLPFFYTVEPITEEDRQTMLTEPEHVKAAQFWYRWGNEPSGSVSFGRYDENDVYRFVGIGPKALAANLPFKNPHA